MKIMKVGILGSGDVGKSFAHAFGALGHEVKIGSRSPEKLREFVAGKGERVSSGTFEEAASLGDLIVLATHGVATEEAINLAGKKNFAHKVVIDATNPLDSAPALRGYPSDTPIRSASRFNARCPMHVWSKHSTQSVTDSFSSPICPAVLPICSSPATMRR